MKEKIVLKCPACGKGYRLTTKRDGSTRCSFCGHEGKKEEFIVKE